MSTFRVENLHEGVFRITHIKSTLCLMGDGSWLFHFIGNKFRPEMPPINLGKHPLHKAIKIVEEYYGQRIHLGEDVLRVLINKNEGTEEELAVWKKTLHNLLTNIR